MRALPFALSFLAAALAAGCASAERIRGDNGPELCVAAWNRGTADGTAAPEGTLVRHSAGIGYGFVARRASVRLPDARTCAVVFDLDGSVFEFVTGSTGEQPPFGGDRGLSGWLPTHDLRSPEYVRLVGGSWNACQNADGTLVLLSDGSCEPVAPGVRRTSVARSLERRAARNLVASSRRVGRAVFWLGPRFRGSVGEIWSAGPGMRAAAGAAFEGRYYPWRGLPEQNTLGRRLRISVLTYPRRLERLPDCLERLGRRCLEPLQPVLRVERHQQTIVIARTGPGRIPAGMVDEMRRRLTDRPGFSAAELEATGHEDFRLSGYPAGS